MKMIKNRSFTLLLPIGGVRGVLLVLLLLPLYLSAQKPTGPLKGNETTPTRLFHISRSLNANVVCYDANLKDGKLDTSEPITIYWLNRSDNPGHTNGLSFFQRKMAFGYKIRGKGADWTDISLTADSKRTGRVCKINGKYVFTTTINGQRCILTEIFSKAKSRISVEYIELIGTSLKDASRQVERIKK